MTSEVLILNKRAAIVAADSAITSTRGGQQPRYSKSATKIFDLAESGTVAVAFFGNAQIDLVPWEVAIKLFRRSLGAKAFPTAAAYADALVAFLSANQTLFPSAITGNFIASQFDDALLAVVKFAKADQPSLADSSLLLADRQALWKSAAGYVRAQLHSAGVWQSLSEDDLNACIADPIWTQRAKSQLEKVADLDAIEPAELAELAHLLRYCRIDLILSTSGLVVVGYGDDEIFPSYRELEVAGHVGTTLAYRDVSKYQIAHGNGAMIRPLAQTSMIDVFTDGFGDSLREIIHKASAKAMNAVVQDIKSGGVAVPDALAERAISKHHQAFMTEWKKENWSQNYTPLISVIATLDVQEMAHLAETLLVLESLKERVTSPTEEVGGPIDVAVITKGEGLVWIKRKHYFDMDMNLRYAGRLQRSYSK